MENYRDVTIIIPNYNNEKYIEKCIQSVMEQTYPYKKIIVVDDCSTDNSPIMLREMSERFSEIEVVFLKKNGGVSNARNVGMMTAKTEYITFLDGDDFYFNPDKIKNEMELVLEYREKKQDIIAFSPILYVDEQGVDVLRKQSLKKKNQADGDAKIQLLSRTVFMPRDYILKKTILEEVGGYSYPYNFYEDMDLLFRLAFVVPYYCTYKYGTAYRQKTTGLSSRKLKEHKAAVETITKQYVNKLSILEKIRVKGRYFVFSMKNLILQMVKR